MLIKYKGTTSIILKELSLELGVPVNLKESEEILKAFFEKISMNIKGENFIQFISVVPVFLKPFCTIKNNSLAKEHSSLSPAKITRTIKAIMNVLERHVPPATLATMYSYFPQYTFINSISLNKEVAGVYKYS